MNTKVKINGIPLACESECDMLFSTDGWGGYFFIRPIYRHFPDMTGLDDNERNNYKFKNLLDDMYLVGLELIAEDWVNMGFCAALLERYGLVLKEANPITKKNENHDLPMLYMNFEHIAIASDKVKCSDITHKP